MSRDITTYTESIGESGPIIEKADTPAKPKKTRDKIIDLLHQNPKLSATALAAEIDISAKSIQRHLANLKAEGILHRIGPDKGGQWRIND